MLSSTALPTAPSSLPPLSLPSAVVDAEAVVPLLWLLGCALRWLTVAPFYSFASIAYRVPDSSLLVTITALPLPLPFALRQSDCVVDAKGVSWTFTVHDGKEKVFYYNKSAQVELNTLTFEHLSFLHHALLVERVFQHG